MVPLLLLSSCLSEDPRDRIEETQAYTSANDLYINAVGTLYNYIGGNSQSQGLQGTYRGVYDYNTFTTDEAIIPIRGGDWYDGGFWQDLYLHTWKPSDNALEDTWNYLFKVITLCNKGLAALDTYKSLTTTTQYNTWTTETRALRAMFYWYAMDMWGNIPLVTSATQTLTDTKQVKRSEMFKFIVDELQAAEPLLANEHSNQFGNYYGHMTRPVVDFLLAKLLLNAEVYSDDDWTDWLRPDGRQAHVHRRRTTGSTPGRPASPIATRRRLTATRRRVTGCSTSRSITRLHVRTSLPFRLTRRSTPHSSKIYSAHATMRTAVPMARHQRTDHVLPLPR